MCFSLGEREIILISSFLCPVFISISGEENGNLARKRRRKHDDITFCTRSGPERGECLAGRRGDNFREVQLAKTGSSEDSAPSHFNYCPDFSRVRQLSLAENHGKLEICLQPPSFIATFGKFCFPFPFLYPKKLRTLASRFAFICALARRYSIIQSCLWSSKETRE